MVMIDGYPTITGKDGEERIALDSDLEELGEFT